MNAAEIANNLWRRLLRRSWGWNFRLSAGTQSLRGIQPQARLCPWTVKTLGTIAVAADFLDTTPPSCTDHIGECCTSGCHPRVTIAGVETLVRLLAPIIAALSAVLKFFYGITHDYALAIVLLTLLVKVILHPLTRVQLRSMKAMQTLAPELAVLRDKHKDDPKTLNQEMMALYRARKVNPLAGCLPIVVQTPVLWALFQLLVRKGLFGDATVFGIPWIRLDETPWGKLSSALPNHPEWLLLSVFPALVAFTTWVQQRLTITDPQQAKMFAFMPLLIGIFAVNYQVGLSVYWIVSTTAYIGEYLWVVGPRRAVPAVPPQPQVDEEEPAAAPDIQVRKRRKRRKRR